MRFLWSIIGIPLLLAGCCSVEKSDIPHAVNAAFTADKLTLDGKMSETVWRRAEWVELDMSRPGKPADKQEWERMYKVAGTRQNLINQFSFKVKAAAVWSETGLYFGIIAEDQDVQGKLTVDNSWLWLEDVLEVFLSKGPGHNICELQVNPSNTILLQLSQPVTKLKSFRPETAVFVNGTINDSEKSDKGWSTEIFLPWKFLEQANLAEKPQSMNLPFKCSNIRYAAWDLTIYTQIRINRFTSPGRANPHFPEYYRPLICLPKR